MIIDRERCLTAGFDGYVSEPIGWPVVSGALDDLTSLTSPRSLFVFQPEVLNESCAGLIEIIPEVLESFLKEGPSDIDRLVAALAVGDLPSARRATHCLKGACLTVGAESLAAACQRIENLDDNASVAVDATRDAFAGEWELLRAAIESYRDEIGLANGAG